VQPIDFKALQMNENFKNPEKKLGKNGIELNLGSIFSRIHFVSSKGY